MAVEGIGASQRSLLRVLTCGSVDDGKSTLIGRLLFDSQLVMEDQLAALEADSRKVGTQGEDLDFALLVDGLQAEREQGITIDVAYRYFATPHRKFIVADTPGHEQYTRNMATGASNCDVAIILVDARKGVLSQTRRHSCIVHLLGIRHAVVAVNKMDLVDYSQERFDEIERDYRAFAERLGIEKVTCIPISALRGDNVIIKSQALDWYHGSALLPFLEVLEVDEDRSSQPMRFPVQLVCRPNLDFRGFAGTLASGKVAVGDELVALPSAKTSKVARIVTMDGDVETAESGQSVTLTLEDEIDISRGDMLCAGDDRATVSDQVAAMIVWMSEDPLIPGRPLQIRCGNQWSTAQITQLRYKLNVDNLDELATEKLDLNEIGLCNLSISRQIAFDPYEENPTTGSFILVDRMTNETVGAGLIRFGLRRATNIHIQSLDIDKQTRASALGQTPFCLWFTGLSGSGKSTVANLLEKQLHASGKHTYILDGDNVRHGLNKDLGFKEVDRVENIRRVAEVAKLMTDAGLIAMVSFISPFEAERQMARELFAEGEFVEIFVDTPIEICEQRDAKGLYKKARAGQIANFTGISSPFERPDNADIHLAGGQSEPEILVEQVMSELKARRLI